MQSFSQPSILLTDLLSVRYYVRYKIADAFCVQVTIISTSGL